MFFLRHPVIYTYHEECPALAEVYDAERLLDMWRRAWLAAYWQPVVLTRSDAERHPQWDVFSRSVSQLPSTNPRHYENACYFRWLAMAAIGGGFLSDADVFPLSSWRPKTARQLSIYSVDYLEGHATCPCFVHGTVAQYEQVCERFAATSKAEFPNHVSDQILLRRGVAPFRLRRDVLTYGDPRLRTARAIHFKTDSLRGFGLEKAASVRSAIQQLLASQPTSSWRVQFLAAALSMVDS